MDKVDALILPENNGVFYGYDKDDDGLWWAAPSQIALDCLSGNGRMPAEGDAMIEWMQGAEDAWRKATSTAIKIPEWIE